MKILHTADLHLDSAFCASTPTEADARRREQREVLKRIFATAKENDCDMMLIAGDLFDTVYVTPETAELCLSLFSDFGKPVVISPGNHDPYVRGSFYKTNLPENVYVFSSTELQYFDFPELGVTVAGYAFTSQSLPTSPLAAPAISRNNESVLLLCAHAELDTPTSRYAPVMSADIRRHGFKYSALGHVHNIPKAAEDIRYCGFAQGRSFDELGDGGVLIVKINENGSLDVTEHIVSEQRFLWEEILVDGLGDTSNIEHVVREKISTLLNGKKTHLRIELTGTTDVDPSPVISAIKADDFPSLCSLRIINDTLCIPDIDFLRKDPSLRGELYRVLEGKLMSDEPSERALALRALRIGLAAIDGKEFTDGGRV